MQPDKDTPLQIAMVAHQYWPTAGSATQRLGVLVRELRRTGWRINVLTCLPLNTEAAAIVGPNGESVHYVAGPERASTGFVRVRKLFEFAFGAWRAGKAHSADIVVTDPPPTAALAALALARRTGVPLVYYMSDSWAAASAESHKLIPRLAHPMISKLERAVLRRSDIVLAVTPRMARIAEAAGARSVSTFPNGVPLDIFRPEGEKWAPASDNRPFFLYAGNAGLVHGAEIFADAAEQLWVEGEDFSLVFMGYGMDLGRIESLRKAWPDRVFLYGAQPADTVAAAYRTAAGALSSLRPVAGYSDARPIKSLSGLACGCPPVYAGDGDFAELLLKNDLGYVSEWSKAGASISMRSCLADISSARGINLKERCAEFARQEFDSSLGARSIERLLRERAMGHKETVEGIGRRRTGRSRRRMKIPPFGKGALSE